MAVQYRANTYLEELEETSIVQENHFGEENLREVCKASRSLFADMSKVYGCDDPQKLYPDVLNKTTVVNAQMAERLFAAIYLLDRCCLPLLSSARFRIEDLQE